MTSDEAFRAARNWIEREYPTEAVIMSPIAITNPERERDFISGYTQGRADAWRWREIYTEGYPELMTPVLLYREGQPAMTGWVDRENDEHGAIFFSTQNGDEELPHDYFTHWLPIKLPGGEND